MDLLLGEGREALGPERGTEQRADQWLVCRATRAFHDSWRARARRAAWLRWNPDAVYTVFHMDLLVFSVETTQAGVPETPRVSKSTTRGMTGVGPKVCLFFSV